MVTDDVCFRMQSSKQIAVDRARSSFRLGDANVRSDSSMSCPHASLNLIIAHMGIHKSTTAECNEYTESHAWAHAGAKRSRVSAAKMSLFSMQKTRIIGKIFNKNIDLLEYCEIMIEKWLEILNEYLKTKSQKEVIIFSKKVI